MIALLLPVLALFLQAPTAAVRIVTDPAGAEVWIGSARMGVTADDGLVLTGLPEGPAELTVRLAGHRDVVRRLTFAATDTATETIHVRLTPVGDAGKRKGSKAAKVALVAGVAAAAAGAGLALAGGSDPLEEDDDGDGLSERAGDCNDADREVKPGGPFSVTVSTFARDAVHCAAGYAPIEVRGTNLGCETVQVFSVTLTDELIAGGCFGGSSQPFSVPIDARLVGTGMRDHLIARRQFSGTIGCCRRGVCAVESACDFASEYAIVTSAGTHFARFTYTVRYPLGPSCPACPEGLGGPFVRMSGPD